MGRRKTRGRAATIMDRKRFFVNKDGQLSAARVLLVTGILAWLLGLVTATLAPRLGLAGAASIWIPSLVAAAVLAALVYFLVAVPIKRAYLERLLGTTSSEDKSLFVTIDPLTRTLNRRGITSTLLEAMAQAQRYGSPLSVAVVDIDALARINDRYGDATGNKVLELVGYTVTEGLRLPDRVGRQTDDEFLVVMPQTKAAAALKVAERIRTAIEAAEVETDTQRFKVSVSIGVAEFHKGQDLEKFLSNAQSALVAAKDGAGNRVVRYKAERKRSS